jgi:hypothetical protein
MRAVLALVAAFALPPAYTSATTLNRLCRDTCARLLASCSGGGCQRQVLKRCRREGPGFCLPACPVIGTTTTTVRVSTSTTRTSTTATSSTTATTLGPDVSIRVDSVQAYTCNGAPGLLLGVTTCAVGGATGVNLNPSHYSLTQSGITHHDYEVCTITQYCTAGVSLSAPACYSCRLVFAFNDDGSERRLDYNDPFTRYDASTTF